MIAWIAFAFFVFVGLPIYWTAFPPRQATSLADGNYGNECCEVISLKNGQLTIPHDQTTYFVEYDKAGNYVLPRHLVGVRDGHVFIDRGRGPLKLRLDSSYPTQAIELANDPSYPEYQVFNFKRISEHGSN